MSHEIHGVTFAVGSEVAWNEANGWKVEEKAPPKPVEKPIEELATEETEVIAPRRGRPPLRK